MRRELRTLVRATVSKGCAAFVLWATNGYDPCEQAADTEQSEGAHKEKEKETPSNKQRTSTYGGFAGGVGLDRLFPRMVTVASFKNEESSFAISLFKLKQRLTPEEAAFEVEEIKGTFLIFLKIRNIPPF